MEGHKTIRMGFRDIRRIRKEDVDEMLSQRIRKQFTTIEDFIARTNFDKAVLSHLTIANAFDCFGIDRRHSFWKSLEFKTLMRKQSNSMQLSLFDEHIQMEDGPKIFDPMTDLEEAVIDFRTIGYSLKGSLMKQLRVEVPHLPPTNSNLIRNLKRDATVRSAGIVLYDNFSRFVIAWNIETILPGHERHCEGDWNSGGGCNNPIEAEPEKILANWYFQNCQELPLP